MKIAFILGTFPELSEVFILHQVTGLLDLGHDVEIFALRPQNGTAAHPDVEKYGLLERTHYVDMPKAKLFRLLKALTLVPVDLFRAPGDCLRCLNIFRLGKRAVSFEPFYYWRTSRGKHFDMAFCHFGMRGTMGLCLKDTGIAAKCVVMFHGHDVNSYLKRHGPNVYKQLFLRGDWFLTNCDHLAQKLKAAGCPADKLSIHRIGVELDKFPYVPKTWNSENPINILTVARLIPVKGLPYAIQAMFRLRRRFPSVQFRYIIVGDGPLRQQLVDLAAKDELLDSVILFTGGLPQPQVIEWFRRSHLFLLPSAKQPSGEQEGTPTVLLEAQASGLPVISSTLSGIPEIVANGAGVLVKDGKVDRIVEALSSLLERPDDWPNMGLTGRKFVETYHDIQKLNRELLTLFERVLLSKWTD